MTLAIEIEEEDDGRWIAEVPSLPGVLAYGSTEAEARARAQALALRVLADRLEHDEADPDLMSISETGRTAPSRYSCFTSSAIAASASAASPKYMRLFGR